MKKLLEEKTVIVTGTARGMGKQMVSVFAENGANVFACARTENDEHKAFCAEVSEKTGNQITPVYFELTDEGAVKEGIKTIRGYKTPINGLVNNAGISLTALYQMTRKEDLVKINDTNYISQYVFTQYVVKLMQRNGGGSIVNISSSAAIDCNPGLSAYAASKASIAAMTKSISHELAAGGIRANAICPGVTDTNMISGMHDYILEIQKKASFLKKIATPADIAYVAMYLLSDYSSYITGQVISVDGGVTQYQKRQ